MTAGAEKQLDDQEEESGSPLNDLLGFAKEAYEAVPEIGYGRRWYDLPYLCLHGILTSGTGRRLPRKISEGLNRVLNSLKTYNTYERDRAWSRDDPTRNLVVPSGESVRMPGIWVCEFFPPSQFESLKQILKRRGWDKNRLLVNTSEPDMLEQVRNGESGIWWNLGTVASLRDASLGPCAWSNDIEREILPVEFDYINLAGLQVGPGLTTIVAHFGLSDQGQCSLNEVWHATHEPHLIKEKRQSRAEDRLWSGFSETLGERARIHCLAREWMIQNCPGVFAADKSTQQPLLDLLLFKDRDPILDQQVNRNSFNAYLALGINSGDWSLTVADEFPSLLLQSVEQFIKPNSTLKGQNTWTLLGQTAKVLSAVPDIIKDGQEEYHAIRFHLDSLLQIFFVRLAMSDFLKLKEQQNSSLRDTARSRHGRFSRKDLQILRDNFLTGSLDTTSIARDIHAFTFSLGYTRSDIRFVRKLSVRREDLDRKNGETPLEEPADLDEELNSYLNKKAKELVDFDRDYRDILSTVASLGASIDTSKTQRTAIIIAVIALLVSLAGLLINRAG